MRQIINTKITKQAKAKRLGDTISSNLQQFDIINLTAREEKIEIKNPVQIIRIWSNLYLYEINDVINDLKSEGFQDKELAKRFRLALLEKLSIRDATESVNSIFEYYQEMIRLYLSKEPIEKINKIVDTSVRGGIAWCE
jgi:hypothetical protein